MCKSVRRCSPITHKDDSCYFFFRFLVVLLLDLVEKNLELFGALLAVLPVPSSCAPGIFLKLQPEAMTGKHCVALLDLDIKLSMQRLTILSALEHQTQKTVQTSILQRAQRFLHVSVKRIRLGPRTEVVQNLPAAHLSVLRERGFTKFLYTTIDGN